MENIKLVLGAFDAVTSRLCKRKGADFIWTSSLVSSAMVGNEDTGITDANSLSSFIEVLHKGHDAVIVDFDIGGRDEKELYKNARIMKELGVRGVCIEDENYPKINAMISSDKRRLIQPELMAKKLSVFKEILDKSALVIARTHSLIASENLDELQRRVDMYSSAGADVLVIHYTGKDWDFYDKTVSAVRISKPLMVILSKEDYIPCQVARMKNVEYIVFPNQLYRKMLNSLIGIDRGNIINGEKWENLISIEDLFKLIAI